MTVSKHIPVLAGGLALAIALFPAPEAARAQTPTDDRNHCGANSGSSLSCTAAAYGRGIIYWGQTNAVTLTVPGTATTATITASTTAFDGLDNGISIRTNPHPSQVRNVMLTVGGTGAVAIVQGSTPDANAWHANHGILVYPGAANGSTVTVDVKSGVTIGTATTSMSNTGIEVVDVPGAVSVTSAARIYAGVRGIRVGNAAGTTMVTNSGAITAGGDGIYVRSWNSAGAVTVANSGAIASDARGIYVEDGGSAGATTVTSSGAITADGDGIFAKTAGQDAAGANAGVSIAHSAGAIAAGGMGVRAHVGAARQETDTEHADYVAPMNAGLAKISVTGGSVSSTSTAIRAVNHEAGSVEVSVSEGVTLTSTAGRGIHAELTDAGNPGGTVSVTNAGTISAAKNGINALRGGGAGAVTVTNSGAIEAGGRGIFVVAKGGGGAVTVTNSGALGTADAPVAQGIFAAHDGVGASGGVTVESSGAIMATDNGILARVRGQDVANANVGVTVTHSAGAIVVASDEPIRETTPDGSQGVKHGLVVGVGGWRWETDTGHDRYVAPVNTGLAKAAVTGGSITSKGNAVVVANYEAGGVEIDVSAGVELTSTHGRGIEADLRDVGNKGGTIKITQAGAVSAAKSGVSAAVAWAGGAGPDRVIDVTWTGTFASRASQPTPLANIGDTLGAARSRILGEDDLDIRYAQGYAGIDAGVMKLAPLMDVVTASDDPGAFEDAAAVTALFDAGADAATKARAAAIVAQFRALLGNEDLETIPGADDVDADGDGSYSDAEITAYLSADDARRRTLLRNVLALSFTDEEKAVFEALLRGGDVDAALAAVPDASDAYTTAVKALVGNHNTGDVRIAVNGGSIDSSGDGIRAWFARSHASNGGIEVIVAEGATVTGDAAGIYVANAGDGLRVEKKYTSPEVQDANEDLGADALVSFPDYLNQVVRVQGTVTGGTDAAVHLDGGGALIVTGTGKLVAGSSGRAVLVNDPGPAVIYIEGEVTGGAGPEGTPAPAAVHLTGGGSVTVAEGATVTGGAAGIYVSGVGTGLRVEKKYTSKEVQEANEDLGADDLVTLTDYLDQVVRVQGTVTGGTDAAVHLDGGGALIVTGAGKLVAGSSGRAVLVNDPGPAVIYIEGEVTGGEGADAAVHLTGGGSVTIGLNGRVDANGAMSAIRGDNAPTALIVHSTSTVGTLTQEQARADLARIEGGIVGDGIEEVTFAEVKNGVPTGFTRDGLLPVGDDGTVDLGGLRFSCNAQDGRCRLYEALPSILLAMNGLPTRAERASAARDGNGGWVRIEGGGGKWTADRSASFGPKLSFDHSRYGVRAGADAAVGESGRLGASVHGFRGDAKVPSSGMAKLSGVGVGVHATAMLGGFHVDAQAATTWYDVDLKSSTRPMTPLLKADVKGRGHAVGIEVGRRTPVTDEVSVTPRAGVVWSEVSLNDFTDEDEIGSGAEVSVEEGESLTGRAGVSVESEASEGVRLFGTVDVTHEFSEETEVAVSGTPLKASAEKTGIRFGVGGTFDLGDGASLQGTAGYALTGGSGNRAYGGGLNLIVSF